MPPGQRYLRLALGGVIPRVVALLKPSLLLRIVHLFENALRHLLRHLLRHHLHTLLDGEVQTRWGTNIQRLQASASDETRVAFVALVSFHVDCCQKTHRDDTGEYYIERLFEELEKRPDVAREDLARMEFAYLPFFHRRKQPLTLHRLLVESPEFFVSTICTVFKPASNEAPVLTEQERKLATAAYELLNSLEVLPGKVDGSVDFPTLQAWTDEVRQRAVQADRSTITDARIGHLLAHSPVDPEDQAWPHKAVRHLGEHLSSDTVEEAVRNERFNMRGVYSKAMGEGGLQERELAEQAKGWARAMPEFPRTANMLSAIAEMWFREGERADATAAKEALRW